MLVSVQHHCVAANNDFFWLPTTLRVCQSPLLAVLTKCFRGPWQPACVLNVLVHAYSIWCTERNDITHNTDYKLNWAPEKILLTTILCIHLQPVISWTRTCVLSGPVILQEGLRNPAFPLSCLKLLHSPKALELFLVRADLWNMETYQLVIPICSCYSLCKVKLFIHSGTPNPLKGQVVAFTMQLHETPHPPHLLKYLIVWPRNGSSQ